MNKILISFFSVILPRIMKFLNNHAEEMLDDILNKFYKNFKEKLDMLLNSLIISINFFA